MLNIILLILVLVTMSIIPYLIIRISKMFNATTKSRERTNISYDDVEKSNDSPPIITNKEIEEIDGEIEFSKVVKNHEIILEVFKQRFLMEKIIRNTYFAVFKYFNSKIPVSRMGEQLFYKKVFDEVTASMVRKYYGWYSQIVHDNAIIYSEDYYLDHLMSIKALNSNLFKQFGKLKEYTEVTA